MKVSSVLPTPSVNRRSERSIDVPSCGTELTRCVMVWDRNSCARHATVTSSSLRSLAFCSNIMRKRLARKRRSRTSLLVLLQWKIVALISYVVALPTLTLTQSLPSSTISALNRSVLYLSRMVTPAIRVKSFRMLRRMLLLKTLTLIQLKLKTYRLLKHSSSKAILRERRKPIMKTPIASLSIAARATLDMHSLNNEGGEGNQIQTRMVDIVDHKG